MSARSRRCGLEGEGVSGTKNLTLAGDAAEDGESLAFVLLDGHAFLVVLAGAWEAAVKRHSLLVVDPVVCVS